MTGKGYDRWFDKSFTLCIGSNGRVRSFYYNQCSPVLIIFELIRILFLGGFQC